MSQGFDMDIQLIVDYLPQISRGLLVTLELIVVTTLLGFIFAVPLALMRISKKWWLRFPAYGYIYFFRGTPLLVQLFIIYYGLAQFEVVRESIFWPVLREPFWCCVIAFSLNTTSYAGEILRGAIQSVGKGQIEAAQSIGMNRIQIYVRIIGPQAILIALPGYCNEVIMSMKGTALASTVSLLELTGITRNIISETFKPVEMFFVAGGVYMLLTWILLRLFDLVEHRFSAHRRQILDGNGVCANKTEQSMAAV